MNKFCKWSCFS